MKQNANAKSNKKKRAGRSSAPSFAPSFARPSPSRSVPASTLPPCVQDAISIPPSDTDPDGSYTGRPRAENEKPVQDADDL